MDKAENQQDRKEEDKPQQPPRIRLSSILTVIFLAFAAIALAYIAGVMSGRQSVSESRQADVEPPEAPIVENQAESDGQKILSAEELEFARVLRGQPEAKKNVAKEPPAAQPEKAAASVQAAELIPTDAPSLPKAPPAQSAATSEEDTDILMDYVFQIGAFRDENSVDALRQKLEGYGLRTRMSREGKMLVVYVLLRGNTARRDDVFRIARELRLGEPLLRSQKPVAR